MLRSDNNTPGEAIAKTKRQRAQIQDSTPEEKEDIVAEMERQRVYTLARPQQYASNFLGEDQLSTTTAGASST